MRLNEYLAEKKFEFEEIYLDDTSGGVKDCRVFSENGSELILLTENDMIRIEWPNSDFNVFWNIEFNNQKKGMQIISPNGRINVYEKNAFTSIEPDNNNSQSIDRSLFVDHVGGGLVWLFKQLFHKLVLIFLF